MIRAAEEKDIPRIVELGSQSLAEGPYKDLLADKPEVTGNLAARLLNLDTAKILVAEDDGVIVGVFAFVVFPHYFSGETVAGEVIWYVQPESRRGSNALELLWAAERQAYELGAKKMQLTAPTDEIAAMYGMLRGYVKVETAFQRNLSRFDGGAVCQSPLV